ncbi:MAG: hypothetical protein ABGY24_04410 [bacterium]
MVSVAEVPEVPEVRADVDRVDVDRVVSEASVDKAVVGKVDLAVEEAPVVLAVPVDPAA